MATYAQSVGSFQPINRVYTLSIKIYGQAATIPTSVGADPNLWHYHALDRYTDAAGTAPIHTIDSSGRVFTEAMSPPNINYTLGDFFQIWGLTFNDSCLSNICISNSTIINMYVNGEQYFGDYGSYIPQNNDVILITVGPPSQLQTEPTLTYDPVLCDEFLLCA